MRYKTYPHNPPHLFIPNAKYFITGSTYKRVSYLKSDEAKWQLIISIQKAFKQYHWELEDWVILDNHYHLMGNAPDEVETLSKIINDVHKFNALWIKKNISESAGVKKIWYNYWDTCITYETSYFARLNYIWYNPVKHGYIDNPEDWELGSYHQRIREVEDGIERIKREYPWDKLNLKDDF